MKPNIDPKKIDALVSSRFIERVFPSPDMLREKLLSGGRMSIYVGVDPTSPHLHLGHSTNLLLMKQFQELGHRVILLIGDFTAQIGDPTGKSITRRALTHDQVLCHAEGYKDQAGSILDFSSKTNPAEFLFNSEWLSKLSPAEIIGLMAKITVGQMIKRDMFQERIKNQKEIYLHEFVYPLLQGYDSVAMNVDAEMGGNDQTFNMLVGRDLAKAYLGKEKIVVATKLLINPKTEAKLMSKSEGNYIALSETSEEIYGKVMALPDEVVGELLRLCTQMPTADIRAFEEANDPKAAKEAAAFAVAELYHGKEAAQAAKEAFASRFAKKEIPLDIPERAYPVLKIKTQGTAQVLVDIDVATSKGAARRLIAQNGVRIDGQVPGEYIELNPGSQTCIISWGKRHVIKLVLTS